MRIYRNGSEPTTRAPEAGFTGDVQIGGYFQRPTPSRLTGATVVFPPSARTPWKVSPLGQTLIVTSGRGRAQCEGEEIVEVYAGDTIWFAPGQRHWEGAAPGHAMTYVAIQEGAVDFLRAVTDGEYQDGPPTASGR